MQDRQISPAFPGNCFQTATSVERDSASNLSRSSGEDAASNGALSLRSRPLCHAGSLTSLSDLGGRAGSSEN